MPETPAPASNSGGSIVEADGLKIDLKNRWLAAFLAFLFPGAGHWYQGRFGKAGLFSSCIMLLFVVGMVIGEGRVVYASWVPQDYRWYYCLQAGVGLPAAPAAVQWYRESRNPGVAPLWNGFMARPSLQKLSDYHLDTAAGFDLGTLYTMVAGLLNILVIFDAYGGPLAIPGHASRKKKSE